LARCNGVKLAEAVAGTVLSLAQAAKRNTLASSEERVNKRLSSTSTRPS
jgi:hypothetical protein